MLICHQKKVRNRNIFQVIGVIWKQLQSHPRNFKWLTCNFAPNSNNFVPNFQVMFFANMSSKMVRFWENISGISRYFMSNLWPFSGTILYPISHLFLMISLQYVTILPNTQIFSALRSTYISPCILIFFFIQFLIVFLKTEIFSALQSTYIYR